MSGALSMLLPCLWVVLPEESSLFDDDVSSKGRIDFVPNSPRARKRIESKLLEV